MKRWHSLGKDWLAALLLAASLVSLVHADCHVPSALTHGGPAAACAVIDHAGAHLEPFEPCDAHHVIDACVTAARQATARDLPVDHSACFLPEPPAEPVFPCLHEPAWPTDSGAALRVAADRAPPRA